MQAFVFNTRPAIFQDRACARRWAISSISNGPTRTCSTAPTRRTKSYFSNSELACVRAARAGDELEDPRAVQGRDSDAVFTDDVRAADDRRLRQHPRQSAPGAAAPERGGLDREGRQARQRRKRRAVRVRDPAGAARVRARRAALRRRTSRALGITMNVRTVDPAQYENRMRQLRFRHDGRRLGRIAVARQRAARLLDLGARPTSPAATTYAGIKNTAVDALVDLVIARARPRRASSTARMRSTACCSAGYYVIPNWHLDVLPRRLLGQVRPARRSSPPYALGARHLVDRSGRAPARSRRKSRRCRRSERVTPMLAYIAPPHPADRPDAVRHHPGQFRHRPGGAGRAGRAADRAN